jgi:hypothetical protein
MKPIEIGALRTQPEGFKAFIPHPFPPTSGFSFDPKMEGMKTAPKETLDKWRADFQKTWDATPER